MTENEDTANDQPRKLPKPWRKFWRHESQRFRALSDDARALAAYVLKFADDDGFLGPVRTTRERVAAALMRPPNARRFRRWEKAAAELFNHGTFEERDGSVYFANFKEYQARRARDERDSPSAEVEAEVTETEAPKSSPVPSPYPKPYPQATDKTCNLSESLGRDPTPFKREREILKKEPKRSALSAHKSSALTVLQGGKADDAKADDFARADFSEESFREYEAQCERFESRRLTAKSFARFFFEQYEAETANCRAGKFNGNVIAQWQDEVRPRLDEWFPDDDDEAKDYIENQVSAFCQLVACGSEVIQSSAIALFMRKLGSWSRMRDDFEENGTVSPWAN